MLFKSSKKQADVDATEAHEFRREKRTAVQGASNPAVAIIDGAPYEIRDLSHSGFCVLIDETRALEKMHVRIIQGSKTVAEGYALRCWSQTGASGYRLTRNLEIDRSADVAPDPASRARLMRRRAAEETRRLRTRGVGSYTVTAGEFDDVDAPSATTPAAGGVTDLRARLGLRG